MPRLPPLGRCSQPYKQSLDSASRFSDPSKAVRTLHIADAIQGTRKDSTGEIFGD